MIAPSRIEWDTILTSVRPDLALEEILKSGVLEGIFPELHKLAGFGGAETGHKDLWDHTKIVVRQTLPRPMLRWAALFHDCGKPECLTQNQDSGSISFHLHEMASARLFENAARRSKLFHASEVRHISAIIRLLGKVEAYSPAWTDSAVRRLARDLGELAQDVLAVARADCSSRNPERRRDVQARCHALKTRLADVAKKDATPPALPRGLGNAIMRRLGFTAAVTREQALEMKRIMGALETMVENGQLPRSGDLNVYLEKLPSLLL